MYVLFAIVATLIVLFALLTYSRIWLGAEAYLYAKSRPARVRPHEAHRPAPPGEGAAPAGTPSTRAAPPQGESTPAASVHPLQARETPPMGTSSPDLDPLRARITEAEAEQARLFEAYDTRFRSLSAADTLKVRSELQALYARAEDMRSRLLDLKNELRRALGQKPWPH